MDFPHQTGILHDIVLQGRVQLHVPLGTVYTGRAKQLLEGSRPYNFHQENSKFSICALLLAGNLNSGWDSRIIAVFRSRCTRSAFFPNTVGV